MVRIGNIETKNLTFSAPIAGYSNYVYREIVMEHGAGFVCAEMVSDKALCFNNQNTFDMLEVSKNEHPMAEHCHSIIEIKPEEFQGVNRII